MRINKNIEAKSKLLLNPLFPTLKKGIIQLFIVSLPKVPEFWCFFSNTKLLIFGNFYFIIGKSLNSFIVLLLSLSCKAQEFDLRNMKRFDEKVFKDWEVDTQYVQMYDWDRFLKKGDERVRIIKTDSFIQVEVSSIANPYKNKYKYDIRTKRLILQSYFFYNCPIGIWKDWSKTDRLIKEVDVKIKESLRSPLPILTTKSNI